MSVHDTQNPESREAALAAATDAVRDGKLIVLPTDTVYGIGADAFTPDAVADLLEAKGRGRDVPPPVLVGDHAVLLALAMDVADYVEQLAEEFWPGPLTLILRAQPSLTWDLGETRGTVALRMPDDEVALELLRRTGPLAVSSANRHGKSAALTVLDAATQLGDSVEEYLDGGTAKIGTSSTIIDTTVEPPEIVREGVLTKEEIIAAVGDIFAAPEVEDSEDAKGAEEAEGAEGAEGSEESEGSEQATEQDGAEHDPAAQNPAEQADATGAATSLAPAEETDPAVPAGPADPADPAEPSTLEATAAPAASAEAPGVLDLPAEPDLVELSTTPDPESPLENAPTQPDPAPAASDAAAEPAAEAPGTDDPDAAAPRRPGGPGEENAEG